jgi:hypothetical protein
MKNHAIKSVMAMSAAEITFRLNLRIRLAYRRAQLIRRAYRCAQPISHTRSGVRLALAANSILIRVKVSAGSSRFSHTFLHRLALLFDIAKIDQRINLICRSLRVWLDPEYVFRLTLNPRRNLTSDPCTEKLQEWKKLPESRK